MPIQGTPAFDAIALLDIDAISFTTVDPNLTGHAAFVDLKTGNTYGETKLCSRWSKATMAALADLRACMEQDIADVVFVNDSMPNQATGLAARPPEGIGEHATSTNEVNSI
jgi:hypothetical protein